MRKHFFTCAAFILVLACASASLQASTLRFTTTGTFGDYVPTGAPGALSGTQFTLTWDQDSDPVPSASLSNQTFIGNVAATFSSGAATGQYPTGSFYPRFYTGAGGGGYLFDAFLNGNSSLNEVFLFFGQAQLFTGTTAAPHFSAGTWSGSSASNIIYGTDPNARYSVTNATLTVQDVSVPEPATFFLSGLALFGVAFRVGTMRG